MTTTVVTIVTGPDGSCRRPIKDFEELRISLGLGLSKLSELSVPGSLAAWLQGALAP